MCGMAVLQKVVLLWKALEVSRSREVLSGARYSLAAVFSQIYFGHSFKKKYKQQQQQKLANGHSLNPHLN